METWITKFLSCDKKKISPIRLYCFPVSQCVYFCLNPIRRRPLNYFTIELLLVFFFQSVLFRTIDDLMVGWCTRANICLDDVFWNREFRFYVGFYSYFVGKLCFSCYLYGLGYIIYRETWFYL